MNLQKGYGGEPTIEQSYKDFLEFQDIDKEIVLKNPK